MSRVVAAIFDNQSFAEKAARQINEQGLRTEDISIVARENMDAGGTMEEGAGPVGRREIMIIFQTV